jgi:hypothetical protein
VPQGRRELPDRRALKGPQVLPDLPGRPGLLVHKARLGHKVRREYRVL